MSLRMSPPAAVAEFLQAAGWGGAAIAPLAGDASFRRYFRVTDGAREAVLMDAPPPHEDVRPFIHIAEYLSSIGLSAPHILHRDVQRGLLLIEDFGSTRMREAVDANPASESGIYAGVTDLLIELHRHSHSDGLKKHGIEAWLDEVQLFTEWYCPAVDIEVDKAAFVAAFETVLAPSEAQGQRVTELRDYHAENVMLIDGRQGVARFGLLDFQDALIGHPAYDLASMLQDARRDVPVLSITGDGGSRVTAAVAILRRPIGRSRRSATPASWASSRGFGSATASRTTFSSSRACGGCSNVTLRSPASRRSRPGSIPTCHRKPARQPGEIMHEQAADRPPCRCSARA